LKSPADPATPPAAHVEAAWSDPKLANVPVTRTGAASYERRSVISYDERCIDYAGRPLFAPSPGTRLA